MKKLGFLLSLLLLASSLGAQSLSFSIKDQALQELNNIEQQNQQLQETINNSEKNYQELLKSYQALKIDLDNMKSLIAQQEQSSIARELQLTNCEKSLKTSQTISYVLGGIVAGLVVYAIVK